MTIKRFNVKAGLSVGSPLIDVIDADGNATFGSITANTIATTAASIALPNSNISGTLDVSGNATFYGNLTVEGNITLIGSTEVSITDKNITLAYGAANASEANGGGITIAGADASITYLSATDSINFNKGIIGNLTGSASTVTTNAQPNITSLGNLTSVRLDNTVTPITAAVGQMFWDTDSSTMTLGMLNGVQQQVGLENYILVRASSAITNGQVVMFTGANGNNVRAAPADTTSVGFKPEYIIGIATQDIAINDAGYITVFGTVHGLNTNAWTVGDILWVDNTTPGSLTNVQPSDPNFQIQMAAVTKSSGGDGHIQVRPTPFYSLDRATNVQITSPSGGQALVYDGANSLWINGTVSTTSSNIANGTSNVSIPTANGNVNLSANGVANVLVVTSTGMNIKGTIVVNAAILSGNVTAGGFLTEGEVSASGNVSGWNFNVDGNLAVTGNSNLGPVGNVTITGGTSGQVLTTNGSNVLSWTTVGGGTLANGTSNVVIPAANGNVNTSVGGTANVLVVTTTGANITGNLTLTGSVSATRFTSNVANGTAPFTVTSVTRVANLNVANANVSDYVQTGTVFGGNYQIGVLQSGGYSSMYGNAAFIANANTGTIFANNFTASSNVSGSRLISTVASGTAPLVVTSTTQVANLRAAAATVADAANAVTFNQATSSAYFIALTPASILSQTPRANSTFAVDIDAATMTVPNLTTTANVTVGSSMNVKGFVETVIATANTGTSIAPDASLGTIRNYTANSNFSFDGFTNPVAGQSSTVIITQDATGGRVMSSTMKFAGGSKTLSTAPNAVDMVCVVYNGSFYLASLAKGYA